MKSSNSPHSLNDSLQYYQERAGNAYCKGQTNFKRVGAIRRSIYEKKIDSGMKFKVIYSNILLQILIKHPGLSLK